MWTYRICGLISDLVFRGGRYANNLCLVDHISSFRRISRLIIFLYFIVSVYSPVVDSIVKENLVYCASQSLHCLLISPAINWGSSNIRPEAPPFSDRIVLFFLCLEVNHFRYYYYMWFQTDNMDYLRTERSVSPSGKHVDVSVAEPKRKSIESYEKEIRQHKGTYSSPVIRMLYKMWGRNACIHATYWSKHDFLELFFLVFVEEDEADNNGEPPTITGYWIRKRDNRARSLHAYVIVVALPVAAIGQLGALFVCVR